MPLVNFLALLIALALQQVVSPESALQSRSWLLSWAEYVGRFVRSPRWHLFLVVAAVLLAGHWILDTIDSWLFGVPLLLVSAVMLLWSVGCDDYHTALERYDARRESDPQAALYCLDSLWMPQAQDVETPQEAAARGAGAAEDLAHRHLLYAGYARWFGPVFFFVLGGPLAAVGYRCVAILAAERGGAATLGTLAALDWIPSRLLVLTFAITGKFLEVMDRLRREQLWRAASAPDLLGAAARAACSNAPGPRVGADLMYRSAGFWLVLLSLLFLLA
jgi:AmpE protein